MPGLPAPVTVTDEYLAAIHGVLGEIRDRLPEPAQQARTGTTKVSEPGKPARPAAKAPAKRAARKS